MSWRALRGFLLPGLGLKRWLLALALGLMLLALGLGFAMATPVSPRVIAVLRALSLSGAPPMVRGGIFIIAGGGLAAVAALRVHRLIVLGTSRGRGRVDVFSTLHGYRRRGQGPRIVAIGGGTGFLQCFEGSNTGRTTSRPSSRWRMMEEAAGAYGRNWECLRPVMLATAWVRCPGTNLLWRTSSTIASTAPQI